MKYFLAINRKNAMQVYTQNFLLGEGGLTLKLYTIYV
jgi:hypothetical protein